MDFTPPPPEKSSIFFRIFYTLKPAQIKALQDTSKNLPTKKVKQKKSVKAEAENATAQLPNRFIAKISAAHNPKLTKKRQTRTGFALERYYEKNNI